MASGSFSRALASRRVIGWKFSLERRDVILIVRLPGDRRGPFEEAKLLYEDLTPPAGETKRLTPVRAGAACAGQRAADKTRTACDRSADLRGRLENSAGCP